MKNEIFVEIAHHHVICNGHRTCGDNFIQRTIPGQNRTVAILSDGMGSGIKANILSTMTSSIIANMVETNEDLQTIARTILKTLPVCSVRGISYATFTIFDFDHKTNRATIVEYDNPPAIIIRNGSIFKPEWEKVEIAGDQKTHTLRRTILITKFEALPHDRITFGSDGVTQSGIGKDGMPFGWGSRKVGNFLLEAVTSNPEIKSDELVMKVLTQAITNDDNIPRDDISCVSICLRRPEMLLFCSCPPTIEVKSREVADAITAFEGEVVISGYPLAEMVAHELGVQIRKDLTSTDPEVPPMWTLPGVDLVTEGLITLGKTLDIFEKHNGGELRGRGGAYRLCRALLRADSITMIIGLRERVDTPTVWADDYVLRRKVLHAIAEKLEKKYNKNVSINYL